MDSIKLKFKIALGDKDQPSYGELYGPGFHRFLPDNKNDLLEKKLSILNGNIAFWFERRGEKEDGFIVYNSTKELVFEEDICKQGILDAGSLYGQISLNEVPNEVLDALRKNEMGNSHYLSFGKNIVKEISDHSNTLICIFRELYRQYWLKKLDLWDSRVHSLGSYCKNYLSLKYSLDYEETWHNFIPDAPRQTIRGVSNFPTDFSDWISEKDWIDIKNLFDENYEVSISSRFITLAHETYRNGDFKKAFIEAVTALEMVLGCKIKENKKLTKSISKSIQSFQNLPKISQFSLFALECDSLSSTDIENSIKAVEIRNKVVHEGYNPSESDNKVFYSLLASISKINKEQATKFPYNNHGNRCMSIENWEKKSTN